MIRPIGKVYATLNLYWLSFFGKIFHLLVYYNKLWFCNRWLHWAISSGLAWHQDKMSSKSPWQQSRLEIKQNHMIWPIEFPKYRPSNCAGLLFFAQYGCSSTGRCGCFEFFLVVHTFETMLTINHGWFFCCCFVKLSSTVLVLGRAFALDALFWSSTSFLGCTVL